MWHRCGWAADITLDKGQNARYVNLRMISTLLAGVLMESER